ncbi:MAG: acyl carrier protein [Legionella sp.]|nr:acyl carrier protein [Legionella sp.]
MITREHIVEVVKETILEILLGVESDSIVLNQPFKDLGANSVDRVDIFCSSMEQLDIKLPLMTFKQVINASELIDVLYEHIHDTEKT